jgi:uncharacterized protein
MIVSRAVSVDASAADALVLAHGAGGDMNEALLSHLCTELPAAGVTTVKFNFPYREARRRVPDPAPVLERAFRDVLAQVRAECAPRRIIVGGKSMGGRMASHLAAQGDDVAGLLLLGYPLHPPDKPGQLRSAHLPQIRCPILFVQGTRDPFCPLSTLREVLSSVTAPVTLHVIDGGDHSFRVPKSTGRSAADIKQEILGVVKEWLVNCATARPKSL